MIFSSLIKAKHNYYAGGTISNTLSTMAGSLKSNIILECKHTRDI